MYSVMMTENSHQTFKTVLTQFLLSRDVKELLRCSYTVGLGIIFKYIRGKLKSYHAPLLSTYTQRLQQIIGIFLPRCVHAIDGDPPRKQRHIENSEAHIVKKILNILDAPPSDDHVDGPASPPIECLFEFTPEQWFEEEKLKQSDYHMDTDEDKIISMFEPL